MQTVSAELPLDLDRAAAWERMRDLSVANNYVPGLSTITFVGPQREGVGTHRRVRMYGLMTLDETVIEWREGAGLTLQLSRGGKRPMPVLREQYFDYALEERDGRVWLVNTMRYETGLGAPGALFERLVLRRVMARQLDHITLAQKLYYETGRRATPAMLEAARSRLGEAG